jgi:subtilase family serine protease
MPEAAAHGADPAGSAAIAPAIPAERKKGFMHPASSADKAFNRHPSMFQIIWRAGCCRPVSILEPDNKRILETKGGKAMHRVPRLLIVLMLIGMLMQLPVAGWASDTRVTKAPEPVKPPVRVAPAVGTVKTARPDLVISKINFSPGNPVTDDEITLWVFVKNAGQGASGPSDVQVKVGGESNPPVIQVPALDPGREYRYTKKVAFGRAGNYIVTATADIRNAVAESQENNNVQQKTLQVKQPAKPDLVVSKINFSPGNPTASDEITLWVFVKNIGPGKAGVSGVQVKVGGESNPPVIQVPALPPGKEWRYSKKFTLGREGGYIVTATADAANTLPETNEANNAAQTTIRVAPAPKPDLVVTKINYSPAKPKQHEQVKVWIFVKNMGPGKSERCNVSKTNSMNNYSIWGEKPVPALDPGQEYRADFFFLSNQAGTYYLRAVADREHRVDETNEDNNTLDRKIVVGPPAN